MTSLMEKSTFKVLKVRQRQPLKTFLSKEKLKFEKGKSFYEMTKREVIQDYKKVVVMRISDGSFITGEEVRNVLKIPTSMITKFSLDLKEIPDFKVFVQSTSHNRIVLPGTSLLYQVGGECVKEQDPGGVAKRRSKRIMKKDPDDKPIIKDFKPERKPKGRKRKLDKENNVVDCSAKVAKEDLKTNEDPLARPGGPTEIAFSFDTTGSMYPCLAEVRRKLQNTINRLKRDIPGIKIAVIAHGDYCDARSAYVTKMCNFTDDARILCDFVRTVGSTFGGDFEECYELVLRESHTKLTWSKDSMKSLVVIGDATPHMPNYPLNKQKIDWRKECETLKSKGIRIYAVQALNVSMSTAFYREMANLTNGYHLMLDQFSSIVDFMMAICYREQGPDQLQHFENEIRGRGMNRELHRLFDNLSGRNTTYVAPAAGDRPDGLVPVNPSRFQVLAVDDRCSIKDFVQRNSLVFKAGRGFYEFTKPETISSKKEVVLVDKVTGDMFTGKEACDMIGAGGHGKVAPASLKKFRVFVQSTSYNRVLMANTGFLYEVDPDH